MGFFTLFTSIIGIVMLMVYLFSDKDEIIKELADQNPAMKESLNNHTTCKLMINDQWIFPLIISVFSAATTVISVIVLIILAMNVIAACNMILGIRQYQPKRTMPFLCSIGFTLLFVVAVTIMNFDKPLFFASLTAVVVLIYFAICTYSLRLELEKREYEENDAECAN